MVTNCPHCGAPVVEKKQGYCYHCGARLRSNAVPTILGCGMSVVLALLGIGTLVVCGGMAFFATCAYGMSNSSGPKPDMTPYTVGAVIGVLLIVGALVSLIGGIVASARSVKPPPPASYPIPPPAIAPSAPAPPPTSEHLWMPVPPANTEPKSPPKSELWNGDPDQVQPKE